VVIIDAAGTIVERVSYDAFGEARHHPAYDINGDGSRTFVDNGIVNNLAVFPGTAITSSSYRAECDLNRDGVINGTDTTIISSAGGYTALPKGDLSDPAVDNPIGYSGYYYDEVVALYHVRYRYYDTVLMRWLNSDPAGYMDSMSLYGYGRGNPVGVTDPTGLYLKWLHDNPDIWDVPGIRERMRGLNEGAKWAKPLGYGLAGTVGGAGLVGVMLATPWPDELAVLGPVLRWAWQSLKKAWEVLNWLYMIDLKVFGQTRPGAGPNISISQGRGAGSKPRIEWHKLPKEGKRAERMPDWARGKCYPHWHQRGPVASGGTGPGSVGQPCQVEVTSMDETTLRDAFKAAIRNCLSLIDAQDFDHVDPTFLLADEIGEDAVESVRTNERWGPMLEHFEAFGDAIFHGYSVVSDRLSVDQARAVLEGIAETDATAEPFIPSEVYGVL